MLSVSPIKNASNTANYFSSRAAYYFEEDAGGSQWLGALRHDLGVSGHVNPAMLDQYLSGHLLDGRQMGRREGDNVHHRPGYELCFSAPKSVSVQALLGRDDRLVQAMWLAAARTLELVEQWYIGARVTNNQVTQIVKTGKLLAACFEHHSSRDGDPNLHIHALIHNITQTPDQTFRALATSRTGDPYGQRGIEAVFKQKKQCGLLFRSELARQIQALTDYTLTFKPDGFFEIAGVPDRVMETFSKRRKSIEKHCETKGDFSAKAAQTANLLTREKKAQAQSAKQCHGKWESEASELGFSPSQVSGHTLHQAATMGSSPATDDAKMTRKKTALLSSKALASKLILAAEQACLEKSLSFSIADVMNEAATRAFSEVAISDLEAAAQHHIATSRWILADDNHYVTREALALRDTLITFVKTAKDTPLLSARKWAAFAPSMTTAHHALLGSLLRANTRVRCLDTNRPDMADVISDFVYAMRAHHKLPVIITHDEQTAVQLRDHIGIPTHVLASLHQRLTNHTFKSSLKPVFFFHQAERMDKTALMKTLLSCKKDQRAAIVLSGNSLAQTPSHHQTLFHQCIAHTATITHHISPCRDSQQSSLILMEAKKQGDRLDMLAVRYRQLIEKDTRVKVFVPGHLAERVTQRCRAVLKAAGKLYDTEHRVPLLAPVHYRVSERHQATYQPNTRWFIGDGLKGIRSYQWATVMTYDPTTQKIGLVLDSGAKKTVLLAHAIDASDIITAYQFKQQSLAIGDRLYATRVIEDEDIHRFERFIVRDINGMNVSLESLDNHLIKTVDATEQPIFAHDYVTPFSRAATMTAQDTALMLAGNHTVHHRAIIRALDNANSVMVISSNNDTLQKHLTSLSPIIPTIINIAPEKTPLQGAMIAVSRAIDFLCERAAAFEQVQLMQTALELGGFMGELAITDIEQAVQRYMHTGELVAQGHWMIPRSMIDCERAILGTVQAGVNAAQPINANAVAPENLTNEQATLFKQVMTTRDRTILLQGYPGTGKTFLLKSIADHAGMRIMGLAVTRVAVNEMKQSGLDAMTVASFLIHQHCDQLTPNHLVIIDEASMLDNSQARTIFEQIASSGARALLSGDVSQCQSIGAGNPLEMLFSHVKPIIAVDIQRQKVRAIKLAVKACINADLPKTATLLGNHIIGTLEQEDNATSQDALLCRHALIANAWLALKPAQRKDVLIPALTNDDRLALCAYMRAGLLKEGTLDEKAIAINALRPANRDSTRYAFQYRKGDMLKVISKCNANLSLDNIYCVTAVDVSCNTLKLEDFNDPDRAPIWAHLPGEQEQHPPFAIYERVELAINAGDRLRLTDNQADWGNFKHDEVQVVAVHDASFTIRLPDNTEKTLSNGTHHAHYLDYNYVFTVYGTQGKTSERVLVDFPAQTKNADMENFLVSISRATHALDVYTSDKANLVKHIQKNTQENKLSNPIATHLIEGYPLFKPPRLDMSEDTKTQPTDRLSHNKRVHQATKDPENTSVVRYDIDRLNGALTHTVHQWLPRLTDKPIKKAGNTLKVGRKNGSLVVTTQGSKAGLWYDFSNDTGGNLIQLIATLHGKSFRDALEDATQIAGGHYTKIQTAMPKKQDGIAPPTQDKGFLEKAKTIARESIPIAGTLAETYLKSHRGISMEPPDNIHFHPSVTPYEGRKAQPALIGIVRDKSGEISRIQVIYLDPKTAAKARQTLTKQTLGKGSYHGLNLNPHAKTDTVILAEGIETGLSLQEAIGDKAAVIVGFGKGQLAKIELPAGTKNVTIACDNDGINTFKGNGYSNVIAHCQSKSIAVSLVIPEKNGQDFQDIHKQQGLDSLRRALTHTISADTFMERNQHTITPETEQQRHQPTPNTHAENTISRQKSQDEITIT